MMTYVIRVRLRFSTLYLLGMFPVNRLTRLTEKYSVNRFSINRTETEKSKYNSADNCRSKQAFG